MSLLSTPLKRMASLWSVRSGPGPGPGSTPTRPTAPSPTPSWPAMCGCSTWTLSMCRASRCSTTSPCTPSPARRWPSWGPPARAKPPSPTSLNRFYDIADGRSATTASTSARSARATLRRALGIVLQDTVLFTGTVMENIRYGNLEATDEECIAAAQLAGADDFITRLPRATRPC